MLQTSFSKLKKCSPTNIYMLYPMAQSIVLVCEEIHKKMPPQWHCPLSSSPSKIILPQGHTSAIHCWHSQQHPSVPTGGLTYKVQTHHINIHIHSYSTLCLWMLCWHSIHSHQNPSQILFTVNSIQWLSVSVAMHAWSD
jgi:hypothetical protein